jgi:hypothetical protein
MTLAQSENTGSCIGAHIVYGRCGERDARSTKEVAEEVSGHKTQSIFESLPDRGHDGCAQLPLVLHKINH